MAEYLFHGLSKMGYEVFYDKEKILVGEDFTEKIKDTITKADCLLALISNNSVDSEWCKAEIYSSLAMNKKFIPIHLSTDQSKIAEHPVLIPKRINYLTIGNDFESTDTLKKIHQMLDSTRGQVLQKFLKRVTLVLISLVAASYILFFFKNNINNWQHSNLRDLKLQEIKESHKVYNQNQIELISSEFYSDKIFKQNIIDYYLDQKNSDVIRINSLLIANHITKVTDDGNLHRWYLENLDWTNNTFVDGDLNTMTFSDGNMGDITFDKSNFNNVVWVNQISNVKFRRCYFSANSLNPRSMIRVDFENCILKGGEINLDNMGDVSFYYKNSTPSSSTITNELALFENMVIKNCIAPPDENVIEILEPDSEVQFNGVLFENCRFIGFIRPKWFENCIFSNCVFPDNFQISKLSETGSIVQNHLFSTTDCL